MKLLIKEEFINFEDAKKIKVTEEFLFDNNEISYTLKSGVTFMAKLENKNLSCYIAIVKQADNKEGFEVVDDFEIALNKVFEYSVDSSDIALTCKFSLKNK